MRRSPFSYYFTQKWRGFFTRTLFISNNFVDIKNMHKNPRLFGLKAHILKNGFERNLFSVKSIVLYENYVSIPLHDFASKSSEAAASFFKMHHPVLRIWHKKNLLLPHTLKRLMEAAACCNIAKHRRFIPAKPKGYECHENCCFKTTPLQNIPKFRKENKKARTSDLSWKLTSFFPKFKVRRICL